MELEKQIEAILFYTAEPTRLTFLAKTLEVKVDEVKKALESLIENLKDRGIKVVNHNEEVSLVTSPELSPLIEKIIKEERERDLGRAGIETLTIIAYKGPVTKKEIEYIRGVNSQYALRSLLLRGLIERNSTKEDERVVVYTITSDTIRFLGLKSITDLPEYESSKQALDVENELNEEVIEE